MYYTNIYGHFNYEFLYEEAVNKFSSDSVFVEIGAYQGKSTCFLAETILKSGKNIKFFVIDNWKGHPSDIDLAKEYERFGDVFSIFNSNMQKAGVANIIETIRGDSAESSIHFNDDSVDFVYIDAAHDYNSVIKDVKSWLPKVKRGGILAGHDYGNTGSGVHTAVDELLGKQNLRVVDNIWIYNK